MKLKYIIEALNNYYSARFPQKKGWFIGKESIEPTKLNLYKKFTVNVYYHIPGKNILAISEEAVDRCPEGEDEALREKVFISLLGTIFIKLNELDKYETI